MQALLYDPVALGLTVGKSMGEEVFVLCPYHTDSKPSAEFNRKTGLFYCFSCGYRSNAKLLAKKCGGVLERAWVDAPRKVSEDIDWRPLLNAPLALDNEYLEGRGVWESQVEKYGIRQFSKGIIFPITDEDGKTVGVLIRQFEGTPRYVVLGQKPPVWPLHEVVSMDGRVAVTEGIFGVLAAERAGIPALTTLSAMVKEDASPWLQRLQPIVCFDDDDSGYIGAARILKFAPLSQVMIPGGEFDNMSPKQWKALWNGKPEMTRSLTKLASLTTDQKKFWERVPHAHRTKRQPQFGSWMKG